MGVCRTKSIQRGATLIEAMIGITIGLIILAGVIALSAQTSRSGFENLRMTRLTQDVRAVMSIITAELQRAGYTEIWDPASTVDIDTLDIDNLGSMGNIQIPSSTCLLYSYDLNGDGDLSNGNFEYFGFRFDSGDLWMRSGGPAASNCSSGTWERIVSGGIDITAFSTSFVTFDTFSTANSQAECDLTTSNICTYFVDDADGDCADTGDVCFDRRVVRISITGRVDGDADTELTVVSDVKVKNDRFNEI